MESKPLLLEEATGLSWEALDQCIEERHVEAVDSVEEWVWASWRDDRHMPEPLWAERDGRATVRPRRTGPPKPSTTKRCFGLDGAGQVRIVHSVYAPTADEQVVEVEALRWPTSAGAWVLVSTQTYFPATPNAVVALGHWVRRSRYVAGQLDGVDFWRFPDETVVFSECYRRDASGAIIGIDNTVHRSYEVSRDAAGSVEKVVIAGPSDDRVVYRRAIVGAVGRARRTVMVELVEGVRRWIDRNVKAAVDAPVAVLLAYGAGERHLLPPSLALATAADLRRARHEQPGALLGELVLPAEIPLFETDPAEFTRVSALGEACRVLNDAWAQTDDDDAVRKLLIEVAREVNASRSAKPPVAFPVELELEDFEKTLRAATTAPQRRFLQRAFDHALEVEPDIPAE